MNIVFKKIIYPCKYVPKAIVLLENNAYWLRIYTLYLKEKKGKVMMHFIREVNIIIFMFI